MFSRRLKNEWQQMVMNLVMIGLIGGLICAAGLVMMWWLFE